MPKGKGDRRLTRVKLDRVLARLSKSPFVSDELRAACQEERVKYDTVQRALQRTGLIELVGFAPWPDKKCPQGSPPRLYRIVGWIDVPVTRKAEVAAR